MKILMLNPPFLPKFSRFSRSPAVTKSGTIYYPIWHAYATGFLEQNGHEVKLLDAPARGLGRDECYQITEDFSPQMVVLYTSTPSIYNDVEIASRLKTILPEAFVVLTGPHVSALPEESLSLDENIDAIARHEYDVTLVELAQVLSNGGSISEVPGLTLRQGDQFITTSERQYIEDLDSLPFVAEVYKKHLNIKDYFYAHCRYPVISIFTSRGCTAQCTYCVYPQQMFGRKARQRSPENIVAEFEYIVSNFPDVKEVLIDDDTFVFNQAVAQEFSKLMIKKKIKIPWTVECRATLSYETMKLMKKAGCRLIVVGFESADDQILKNINKGMTLGKMEKFVKNAKKAGIKIHSCFMAGNRGETQETLEKSLQFAKKINSDTSQFFPLMVYPGTEDYQWANENGYLKTDNFRNWLSEDGMHNCVISTPELSADDLVKFCDYARRSYYLGPKYLLSKVVQIIREPKEIPKTVMSAKTFFKYLFRR